MNIGQFKDTIVLTVALLTFEGCIQREPQATNVASPSAENRPPEVDIAWGPNCNQALLIGDFAMDRATEFSVMQTQESKINQLVKELKHGYGGTLVLAPPDPEIDSPAFLAYYLRAFGEPVNPREYDYRFERILTRLS